jgi:predicted dehydrogenase
MVRVGIVATSPRFKTLAERLHKINGFDPVGYYAAGDAKQALSEKDKVFNSPEELIKASDAVLVSSPQYNYDIAQAVLRSARHLYIDMPFAFDEAQAQHLRNLSHEANVKFQIGLSERLNPAFIAAKQYIQRPLFIEVHRLMNYDTESASGSIVLDHMIHDIDTVLHLTGSTVRKVSANGVSVVSDSPDIANVRLEMNSGCTVNLTASRISRQSMCKTRVFQFNAYVAIDFLKNSYEVVQHTRQNGRLTPEELQELLCGGSINSDISTLQNHIQEQDRVRTELELFLHSINANTNPVVSFNEAYQALDVARQIMEKINNSGID